MSCTLLAAVPRETDWNIRIGKQGYVRVYFDVLCFAIPDISQCVNNYFELEKS